MMRLPAVPPASATAANLPPAACSSFRLSAEWCQQALLGRSALLCSALRSGSDIRANLPFPHPSANLFKLLFCSGRQIVQSRNRACNNVCAISSPRRYTCAPSIAAPPAALDGVPQPKRVKSTECVCRGRKVRSDGEVGTGVGAMSGKEWDEAQTGNGSAVHGGAAARCADTRSAHHIRVRRSADCQARTAPLPVVRCPASNCVSVCGVWCEGG